MKTPTQYPLVWTKKEQCRMCYSCVRECPAKAIRVSQGQAEVIQERCIGCGNCVRVCTQQAKETRSSIKNVESMLVSGAKAAACLAPSFPAEFSEMDYRSLVAMLRNLGFRYVVEVAFGADLVSRQYRELINEGPEGSYIATTCPAIVNYVEKYHPDLVKNLAPIASPMIATARAIHHLYGDDVQVVFIGPCLAKKTEADRPDTFNDVSEVLTFAELRAIFNHRSLTHGDVSLSDFDPPFSGKGAIYPIGRGLLQAADIPEDLLSMNVVSADGTREFIQSLHEFASHEHSVGLLEILCCNGCIMGSGMTTKLPRYSRRAYVSAYARKRYDELDLDLWEKTIESMSCLNMRVAFRENDMRLPSPTKGQLKEILREKGKFSPRDELNCGACGYSTCMDYAIAVHMGLAEGEMCLPYMIETLKKTADELTESYRQLVDTKQALIQSEKLASLGRMASGIAHEINNPLTGILSFSSMLMEDLKNSEHVEDLRTILKETMRCRDIVRGLLDFARETKSRKASGNINAVINDALSILEPYVNSQNIRVERELGDDIPETLLDMNQMRSVINNLCENAAHAMSGGGVLTISTAYDTLEKQIKIKVGDTGSGIRHDHINKIFDPFFTTKEAGKGTGLGLAVTYGIVESHFGTINVTSREGQGSIFTVTLPVR